MARLIDADLLSEELSTLATIITGLRAGKGVLREYMTEYRKSVLRIVDEQPTVDAVEVVRCKDCKSYYTDECGVMCLKSKGLMNISEDDFCSYGERKD